MKKKIMMSMLMSLLLVSFAFPVIAQTTLNVPVTAGDTIEESIITEDITPSTTLGAIVSNIQSVVEKYIEFGAIKVWKDTSGSEQVIDFKLYAFDAGTVTDPSDIIPGSVCYTSELVDINGVNAIWETNCVEAVIGTILAGADAQAISGFDQALMIGSLSLEFKDPANYNKVIYNGNPATYESLTFHVCDSACPLEAELEAIYGGDITSMEYMKLEETGFYNDGFTTETGYMLTFLRDGVRGYLSDINSDQAWDFTEASDITTPGFEVDANSGQTLMILDAGTYDLFGIVP